MKQLTVYGIKNCDTMKKAFAWLDGHKVAYAFHDYKKAGADADLLKRAFKQHGWENVLNRKGATWRALPDKAKEAMNERLAFETALANPSIIRRPMLVRGDDIRLGFDEAEYSKAFASKKA
ncbi:MAG: Spx/MgsR family RNA polymerase-binding regulatory protein [Alphaproteobacteria bacterium]|nr:MAG: Spx/MgsR family RNA polymerase-binding regulatory protein [Alphaproteobacteria bacterium]